MRRKFSMPEFVAAQLEQIKELRAELVGATDAYNESLLRAEAAFKALNLGVTAVVELEPNESDRSGWSQLIRFGKHGHEWRLLLESGPEGGEEEEWSISPLVNASKEIRLLAANRLPDLLGALMTRAREEVEEIRTQDSKINELVTALQGGV